MTDLFPAESLNVDSPRIAWMKRWVLQFKPDLAYDPASFICFSLSNPKMKSGRGDTEDDAMLDWAKQNGVRLWNEEAL